MTTSLIAISWRWTSTPGEVADAAGRCAGIGEMGLQSSRPFADRSASRARLCSGSYACRSPYTEWHGDPILSPTSRVPYDLDISADGKLLSAPMSEVTSDQYLRVWELDKVLKGRYDAALRIPLRTIRAGKLRFHAGQPSTCTAAATTPECPTSFATKWRPGKSKRSRTRSPGNFVPSRWPTGELIVLTCTGEGFVPAIIDPKPLEDVSAIKFLGAEVVDKFPVLKTWQVPPPSTSTTERGDRQGDLPPAVARAWRWTTRFPSVTGYKNSVGIGYTFNIAEPLAFANIGITAAYTPDSQSAGRPARPRQHRGQLSGLARRTLLEPHGFLRHLRPDQAQRKRLCRQDRLRLVGGSTMNHASFRGQVRPCLL